MRYRRQRRERAWLGWPGGARDGQRCRTSLTRPASPSPQPLFVINGKNTSKVSDATRYRVLAAITLLEYRPNAMARQLSLASSSFLGLVADGIATTRSRARSSAAHKMPPGRTTRSFSSPTLAQSRGPSTKPSR